MASSAPRLIVPTPRRAAITADTLAARSVYLLLTNRYRWANLAAAFFCHSRSQNER